MLQIYSFPAILISSVLQSNLLIIDQKPTYLGKVFTWRIKLRCVRRVREWAGFTSLTLSDLEEFAGHVRGIWSHASQ